MRYYGFGNYYLSSIQQGIQNAHVISTMSVKYDKDTEQHRIYEEWAKSHITTVLCNGGNSAGIAELFNIFEDLKQKGMPLPFAKFHEDAQSLDGALTAVGIVVEKRHYELDSEVLPTHVTPENFEDFIRTKDFNEFTFKANELKLGYATWELALIHTIKKYGLAK